MSEPKETKVVTIEELYNKPAIYEVAGEQITLSPNIVMSYLARGSEELTKQEIVMFINMCRYQKLNPFLGEAYLVKFKNNNGPAVAQIIVSKEAYMKRAYDCPNYDGIESGLILERDKKIVEVEGTFYLSTDIVLGGWAKVFMKDKPNHPAVAKVTLQEYSKGQSTWKSMPATMIRKVAQVHALREAFPKDLGGMYVEEEPTFDKGNVVETVGKVKEEVVEKTAKVEAPVLTPSGAPHEEPIVNPVPDGQTSLFEQPHQDPSPNQEPSVRQRPSL